MPFRPYTTEQRTEALAVLAKHGSDLQVARAELTQRWGYAPSLPTLCTWLLSGPNGQGQAITARGPEAGQDGALKGFEGSTATPWAKLLEVVSQTAVDADLALVVICKGTCVRQQGFRQ